MLDVSEMDISEPQVSLNLVLLNVYWIDESNMDDIELGKKKAEVVILNDIGKCFRVSIFAFIRFWYHVYVIRRRMCQS